MNILNLTLTRDNIRPFTRPDLTQGYFRVEDSCGGGTTYESRFIHSRHKKCLIPSVFPISEASSDELSPAKQVLSVEGAGPGGYHNNTHSARTLVEPQKTLVNRSNIFLWWPRMSQFVRAPTTRTTLNDHVSNLARWEVSKSFILNLILTQGQYYKCKLAAIKKEWTNIINVLWI